jgi:hypothetical protein
MGVNRIGTKREWFTIAYFDDKCQPHKAHETNNFMRIEIAEDEMLKLFVESAHEGRFWGARFVAVWPGKLSRQTAMNESHFPTFYIYENGLIERVAPKEPNLYRMTKKKRSTPEVGMQLVPGGYRQGRAF